MRKRSPIPQSRRHVTVFDKDWALLEQLYGTYSASRMGAGNAVKFIVHAWANRVEQKVQGIVDGRGAGGGAGGQVGGPTARDEIAEIEQARERTE